MNLNIFAIFFQFYWTNYPSSCKILFRCYPPDPWGFDTASCHPSTGRMDQRKVHEYFLEDCFG